MIEKIRKQFRKIGKPVSPVASQPKTLTITGAYPRYTSGKRHSGIDFGCQAKDFLCAVASGVVTYTRRGVRGKPGASTVSIKPDVMPDTIITYKHCKPLVQKGDRMRIGDVIGQADLTGNTTGYHLHFEVKRDGKIVEPLTVLNDLQPRLKYRIMSGKWHEPVKNVFEKYNPAGLKVIRGEV